MKEAVLLGEFVAEGNADFAFAGDERCELGAEVTHQALAGEAVAYAVLLLGIVGHGDSLAVIVLAVRGIASLDG